MYFVVSIISGSALKSKQEISFLYDRRIGITVNSRTAHKARDSRHARTTAGFLSVGSPAFFSRIPSANKNNTGKVSRQTGPNSIAASFMPTSKKAEILYDSRNPRRHRTAGIPSPANGRIPATITSNGHRQIDQSTRGISGVMAPSFMASRNARTYAPEERLLSKSHPRIPPKRNPQEIISSAVLPALPSPFLLL